MINWNPFIHPSQIEEIIELSKDKACVIFKHSSRCPISSMAKFRLEGSWDFAEDEVYSFFIDVITDRSISQLIAQTFGIHHESPQLLLIKDGQCIHHSSHLDITVRELRGVFGNSH